MRRILNVVLNPVDGTFAANLLVKTGGEKGLNRTTSVKRILDARMIIGAPALQWYLK